MRSIVLLLATGLCACGTGDDASLDAPEDGDAGDGSTMVDDEDAGGIGPPAELPPTYEPTLGAIHREVFEPSCAWVFCHGGDLLVNLKTVESSYETLIDVEAEGDQCRGMGLVRVVPGEPEASLLYLKITEPPCGRRMPLHYDYSPMLDPREVEQIRAWIARGAPRD